MAERGGFEPPIGFNPYNGLANRRFRPLSHLSIGCGVTRGGLRVTRALSGQTAGRSSLMAPTANHSGASLMQVVLVALRQARPRKADGMGRPGRPLRRCYAAPLVAARRVPPHGNAAPCNK